jgi:hypothetical protein
VILDLQSGTAVPLAGRPLTHPSIGLHWSPDGTRVLGSRFNGPNGVQVWDARTGEVVGHESATVMGGFAWGHMRLRYGWSHPRGALFDFGSPRPPIPLPAEYREGAGKFSPNGERLAGGS